MNITINTNLQAGMAGTVGTGTLSGLGKTESAVQTAETNSDSAVMKAANFDRVDLSETAVQYLEEKSDTDSNNSAEVLKSDISSEETVSKTVSQNSSVVLASELYSYTETELQELMLNGTITRSEYEAELEKRSGESVSSGE